MARHQPEGKQAGKGRRGRACSWRNRRLTGIAEDIVVQDGRVTLNDAVERPDLLDGETRASLLDLGQDRGKDRLPYL